MKPINVLLRMIFATGLVLLPSFCFAQFSISEIISRMPTDPLPFSATKNTRFYDGKSYGIANSDNAIPDKLYENLQLTQYTYAHEYEVISGSSFRKFDIPNSSNKLLAVSFGVSDYRTDVLCVVNPSGQILSTLEVAVIYYTSGDIAIKQFRIDAQGRIIVSTIVPTSTTSIPFTTFTSFTGYRKDVTYSVNAQGKFVQVSSQTFPSKTYTRSYLENRDINIWDDK